MITLWRAGDARRPGDEEWRLVTDGVMGGVSAGAMTATRHQDRECVRMTGRVRLENNGGFVQIARDVPVQRRDVSAYHGLVLEVCGNGEHYGLHLKTGAITLPWQSYRAGFQAPPTWTAVRLPFTGFQPHRLTVPFDASDLRRIAVVAIGRPFDAEVCIAAIELWRT